MSIDTTVIMKDRRSDTDANKALRKLILCGELMANSEGCPKDLAELWHTQFKAARDAGAFG